MYVYINTHFKGAWLMCHSVQKAFSKPCVDCQLILVNDHLIKTVKVVGSAHF